MRFLIRSDETHSRMVAACPIIRTVTQGWVMCGGFPSLLGVPGPVGFSAAGPGTRSSSESHSLTTEASTQSATVNPARPVLIPARSGPSSPQTSRKRPPLRQVGCEVHIGHDPKHVLVASYVVILQAIRESNVELKAVRKHGLHVVHRAEALAAMMAGYRSVAVAGTYSKSSTTTMPAVAFQGLFQGVGAGSIVRLKRGTEQVGQQRSHGIGDIFLAEADESVRSFHYFRLEPANWRRACENPPPS